MKQVKKATNKLFELKFHLQKDIYLLPALGYYPQHSQKVFRCSVNPWVITQPIRYIYIYIVSKKQILYYQGRRNEFCLGVVRILWTGRGRQKSPNLLYKSPILGGVRPPQTPPGPRPLRMGQRKIAKNLKSPKIYILQHFFVCVLYKRIIPTEFDTRLEKKDIYCKVAKIPWNLLWNELENNSRKNAKNILCYLVKSWLYLEEVRSRIWYNVRVVFAILRYLSS